MIARFAFLLFLAACLALAGCQPPSPEVEVALPHGVLRAGHYEYAPLGWRMPLPRDWHVMTGEEIESTLAKGRPLVESALGEEVPDLEKHLLYLSRSPLNAFTAALSPLDEAQGSFEQQTAALIDLVVSSYRQAGMPASAQRSSESIDGTRFELADITLLDRTGQREVLQQKMYIGLFGAQVLTVSITSAQAGELKRVLASWRASRFTSVPGPHTRPSTARAAGSEKAD